MRHKQRVKLREQAPLPFLIEQTSRLPSGENATTDVMPTPPITTLRIAASNKSTSEPATTSESA